MNRAKYMAAGAIISTPELVVQYQDGVPGPSCLQPWHKEDSCLRLDAVGRFWANYDVRQTVLLDYKGYAPSFASGQL